MTDEDGDDEAATDPRNAGVDPAAGGPAFGGVGSAIREHWETFMDDVAATAEELREDGLDVLVLHPGDVTVVTESNRGFDVLVPDDEFETLRSWVEATDYPEHDVYHAEAGIVFVLVVMRAPGTKRAICCPLYYAREDAETLRELADADGALRTHVRRLSEEYVHFVHEDPAPFLPD